MDEKKLSKLLSSVPLGAVRYTPRTGSTNDDALAWATQGAPDFSLLVADEQTAGRGRMGRRWLTPPGAALAFSLVVRLREEEQANIALFSGVCALALVDALTAHGIAALVKWPNDVLINGKKVSGILSEAVWSGNQVESLVLGMGVNVTRAAVPPANLLTFPATSLEDAGLQVDRFTLLRDILFTLARRRAQVLQPGFVQDWSNALAFMGEQVTVWQDGGQHRIGVVRGLEPDGALQLETADGLQSIRHGDVHLRPQSL